MKNLYLLFLFVFALSSLTEASVSISGDALTDPPGIAPGQEYAIISDDFQTGFDALEFVTAGAIDDSSIYGDNFMYIGGGNVTEVFGGFNYVSVDENIDYTESTGPGDQIAILVFDSSTNTVSLGDTFSIWTEPNWILPEDPNATISFGLEFPSLASAANFNGMIVPESSTYALLVGILAIGYSLARRFQIKALQKT